MRRRKRLNEEDEQTIYKAMDRKPNRKSEEFNIPDLKFKNVNQEIFSKNIQEKQITICRGPAGTGKTFIACAQSLNLLIRDGRYKRIYIIKSVTTLKDEEIGFLKGTLEEKMEPFVFSFIHNFEKFAGKTLVQNLRESKVIEVMPIAYLRGINFDNCIVLVDECQNLTRDHLITILTRIGTDSKMILLGDTEQIDRKNKTNSGFNSIIEQVKNIADIGVTSFESSDIVRNPIIEKIIEATKNS